MRDFGGGAYTFNTATWEVPLEVSEIGNLFRYDFAHRHTFTETCNAGWFRYFTPGFEVNLESAPNGPDAGRTVVDFTAGATWVVREEDEIAISWSTPVTGDRNFDTLFVLNYIRHF